MYQTLGVSMRRSIPAWAGETASRAYIQRIGGVYPRVGGGNSTQLRNLLPPIGLSPRGRGKPLPSAAYRLAIGSIPAWAGETYSYQSFAPPVTVYPRVGGGNQALAATASQRPGLSPRGRGKQAQGVSRKQNNRSIPAWAGETLGSVNANVRIVVYPRVGGGNYAFTSSGSSA